MWLPSDWLSYVCSCLSVRVLRWKGYGECRYWVESARKHSVVLRFQLGMIVFAPEHQWIVSMTVSCSICDVRDLQYDHMVIETSARPGLCSKATRPAGCPYQGDGNNDRCRLCSSYGSLWVPRKEALWIDLWRYFISFVTEHPCTIFSSINVSSLTSLEPLVVHTLNSHDNNGIGKLGEIFTSPLSTYPLVSFCYGSHISIQRKPSSGPSSFLVYQHEVLLIRVQLFPHMHWPESVPCYRSKSNDSI